MSWQNSQRNRNLIFSAGLLLSASLAIAMIARAQQESDVTLPLQAPVVPEIPEKRPNDEIRNADAWEAGEEPEDEADDASDDLDDNKDDDENPFYVENDHDEADEVDDVEDRDDVPPIPAQRAAPSRPSKKTNAVYGPMPSPDVWSEDKITEAKLQCDNLLSKAIFTFEPLEPIRKGVCGTPAPIKLEAVEAVLTVAVRPGATLNCTTASAFQRWMVEVVQPSAKTHLDTEITGVVNVASYHCRTRYNDPAQRMSQHAFANALDLSAFITSKGTQISLEKSWEGDTPESRFLKEIHAGACEIFGTVLGPEANAAHKNHFHFDMTKRRYGSYCQ